MHESNPPLPDSDFPPGYLDRALTLIQGGAAAAADPLPGPLLDAFLPEPFRVIGLELRPLVPTDIALLKRIKSPLIDLLTASALNPDLPKPEVTFEEEDMWEIIFAWSRPLPVVRAALAKGRPEFREIALANTGDKLPMDVMLDSAGIVAALAKHFSSAFATRVGHAPAETGDPNFQRPPAPPRTGSAGGSVMSAA